MSDLFKDLKTLIYRYRKGRTEADVIENIREFLDDYDENMGRIKSKCGINNIDPYFYHDERLIKPNAELWMTKDLVGQDYEYTWNAGQPVAEIREPGHYLEDIMRRYMRHSGELEQKDITRIVRLASDERVYIFVRHVALSLLGDLQLTSEQKKRIYHTFQKALADGSPLLAEGVASAIHDMVLRQKHCKKFITLLIDHLEIPPDIRRYYVINQLIRLFPVYYDIILKKPGFFETIFDLLPDDPNATSGISFNLTLRDRWHALNPHVPHIMVKEWKKLHHTTKERIVDILSDGLLYDRKLTFEFARQITAALFINDIIPEKLLKTVSTIRLTESPEKRIKMRELLGYCNKEAVQ